MVHSRLPSFTFVSIATQVTLSLIPRTLRLKVSGYLFWINHFGEERTDFDKAKNLITESITEIIRALPYRERSEIMVSLGTLSQATRSRESVNRR